jgi:inhibitor of cysteine peptidase
MNRNVTVVAIAALLVAAICIAGCTSPSTSSSNQTTTANATQNATSNVTQNVTSTVAAPVSVQLGQNFTLQLQSNPSTGYQWQPSFDASMVSLKNQTYVADQPATTGSGGKDVFTFQAVSVGSTTITFDHISPSGTVTDQTVNYVTVTQTATPQVAFTVSLPGASGSTGYSWQPTYDTSSLNLKSNTVEPSGSQIGAPATQVFTFQVLNTGTATATFDLMPPSGSSTERITVTVTVTQTATPQVAFTVSLPGASGSTGYSWQPTYDTSSLNLKSNTVEPSGSQIGAPATQVFTFQVLNTGTATATFDLMPPSGSSTEHIAVSITVG